MSTREIAELLPATHVRSRFSGGLRRIVAPAAMVLTMIAASIGISTWSYLAQREESLHRADDLIASLEQRIRTQVNGFLAPVARLTTLGPRLLGADALAPGRQSLTESFARGVLADNPQVATVVFAGRDGDFLMYLENDDGGVDTKRIQRDAGRVRTTWTRRGADARTTAVEEVPDDGYDPRDRSWYRDATHPDNPHWSDVYVFFTSRQPGVTVSLPVTDASGDTVAVYGMDISLSRLSDFLAGMEVSRSGRAMIVAEDGEVIAYPDASQLLVEEDGSLRTRTIAELDDAVLSRAWNRYRVEGNGRRVVEVNGERYLSTVTSLAGVVGRPWSVMLVAPETDFTAVIEDNFRSELLLNLCVLAIAALLAGLVVNQGLRADRIERATRRREIELTRQTHAISTLADDGGLHDPHDRAALQRLTHEVAEALGVARVAVWRWRADRSGLDCQDCYDRRSNGHTEGAELLAAGLGALMRSLDAPMVVTNTVTDERTQPLAPTYLQPLGIQCLLTAPVREGGHERAVLWVEDVAREPGWAEAALPFVIGIADLLGLCQRGAVGRDGEPRGAEDQSPPTPTASGDSQPERLPPRYRGALRHAGLDEKRLQRLREATEGEAGASADLYEHVSVLVLLLDNPPAWARSADKESTSHVDALMRHLQGRAEALGVAYVKMLGERIVCAAGFDTDALQGAEAIARLASDLETHCSRMLAAQANGPAFRIGVDTGPALGSALGGQDWIYNLWGDTPAGAQAMAESAVPGSVQVSRASYLLLRDRHLFAHRGHYYVPGLGESSTYLLLGQE